jgi:O-acetyl-ADP-ribose deacetylase
VATHGRFPPGQAVITRAGNLPAKYVIHTVGPVWNNGCSNETQVLASAYRESLRLAEAKKLSSISFPSISTGAYRYPLGQAAKVALETVIRFLKEEAVSLKEVRFVLFDTRTYEVYKTALNSLDY